VRGQHHQDFHHIVSIGVWELAFARRGGAAIIERVGHGLQVRLTSVQFKGPT
jgi:hypothetical protein